MRNHKPNPSGLSVVAFENMTLVASGSSPYVALNSQLTNQQTDQPTNQQTNPQVQRLKLDTEAAMLEMDQILRANVSRSVMCV